MNLKHRISFELLEATDTVLSQGSGEKPNRDRNIALVSLHYGFTGEEGQSVRSLCEDSATALGHAPITRQGGHLVINGFKSKAAAAMLSGAISLPLTSKAAQLLKDNPNRAAFEVVEVLRGEGLVGEGFVLDGVVNAAEVFGMDVGGCSIVQHDTAKFWLDRDHAELPQLVAKLMEKVIIGNGAVNLDALSSAILRAKALIADYEKSGGPEQLLNDIIAGKAIVVADPESMNAGMIEKIYVSLNDRIQKSGLTNRFEIDLADALVSGLVTTAKNYAVDADEKAILLSIGRGIVQASPLGHFLDPDKTWVYIEECHRNRIEARLKKIFSFYDAATVDNIRIGLIRSYKGVGVVPPERVIIAIAKAMRCFVVEGDVIAVAERFPREAEDAYEYKIADLIQKSAAKMGNEIDIERALVPVDRITRAQETAAKFRFSIALNYSPLFFPEKRGVYVPVGQVLNT